MTTSSRRVAAIDGWFTTPSDGSDPALIGRRCDACGTYVFPPRHGTCPNPGCEGESLVPVELSNTGTIWSYTVNHYAPPPPYVAADPFEPYPLAAVQLEREGLIVLGQVAEGVDAATLRVGMPMKLDIGVLYRDADGDHLIYTWAPA
mgnify:CR=1 FL=1